MNKSFFLARDKIQPRFNFVASHFNDDSTACSSKSISTCNFAKTTEQTYLKRQLAISSNSILLYFDVMSKIR